MAATEFVPNQAKTEAITAHVIWLTTGLSCEGDSVAMTGATNPSLEDIITGAIPGMPRVVVHNTVLAVESGQDFMQAWYDAEDGKLDPFVLVLEGSVPNEKINGDGYWTGMGVNPATGQPITTNEWIDRLAPEGGGGGRGRHLRHLRRHPGDEEQPDRGDGAGRLPRLELQVQGRLPIVNIPGCPAQGDNITETLMYLVFALAGMAPPPELDDAARPKWLFGRTVHESCNRAAFYESGDFATEYGSDHRCLVKLGCKGPVVKCNVPLRGWINGIGGCPNVGGICMACTMPGFPDKYMPFMDEDSTGGSRRNVAKFTYGPLLRWGRKHNIKTQVRQGAGVAAQQAGADHRLREAVVRSGHGNCRDAGREEGRRQGDVLGSGDPDRRQPGHPHRDRLRQPAGAQVLQHLDDLPRLRHLHEGDRSARRPLHHQPHLRHLR